MNLWQDAPREFRPSEFRIRRATLPYEVLGHHRCRREAFCVEQQVFAASDRDALDDGTAIPIVAVSCLLGQGDAVVGAVRIHEAAEGHWWGSRLCVSRAMRGAGRIGAELIRFAVSTAAAEGCSRFHAHVQVQNVAMFEHLHWRVLGEATLHGRPHARMEADLAFYPPLAGPDILHIAPVAHDRAGAARARLSS